MSPKSKPQSSLLLAFSVSKLVLDTELISPTKGKMHVVGSGMALDHLIMIWKCELMVPQRHGKLLCRSDGKPLEAWKTRKVPERRCVQNI